MDRRKTDMILHIIIVVSALISIGGYLFGGPDALGASGTLALRYFTIDSNILMAIASSVVLVYALRGKQEPNWVLLLKTAGTTSVTVTLLTVVFFLAPTAAFSSGLKVYFRFFRGPSFVLHFSNPVLAIISYTLLDRKKINARHIGLYGLLPTAVYSVFYMTNVIVRKTWPDFYGFTFGMNLKIIPISLLVMYSLSWAFAFCLFKLRRKEK